MSEEQYETILQAIADLQVSLDSVDLRTQRLVEIVAWTDTDNPEPPEWAGRS